MIVETQTPQIEADTTQMYLRWQPIIHYGFGVVKVAATLTMGGTTGTPARIALGGVASTLLRATAAETAITGQAVNDADAASAVSNAVPMTMNAYKVVVTQTLVKRAILS